MVKVEKVAVTLYTRDTRICLLSPRAYKVRVTFTTFTKLL